MKWFNKKINYLPLRMTSVCFVMFNNNLTLRDLDNPDTVSFVVAHANAAMFMIYPSLDEKELVTRQLIETTFRITR